MSVLNLARSDLLNLAPYSSARMEARAADVMLNANESPWPPPGDSGQALNRYPDPQPEVLLKRLAKLYGVSPPQVLIGRGSDEGIDLLIRGFCRAGQDAVAVCPPTFGMYAVSAGIQGAQVQRIPLDSDFTLDVEFVLASLAPAVKILFLCSPNNPTGGIVPLAAIERIASALAGRGLVIVDEAYIEFASGHSAVSLIGKYENLGVLRTLSKAWSLAGARVGVLLANPLLIAFLRRIMPPYPVPTPCLNAALASLNEDGEEQMRRRVVITRSERERLRGALMNLASVKAVLPSQANFLAVQFDAAPVVYQALLNSGVVVRDLASYPRLEGYLRISVGTPEENTRLIRVLSDRAEAA